MNEMIEKLNNTCDIKLIVATVAMTISAVSMCIGFKFEECTFGRSISTVVHLFTGIIGIVYFVMAFSSF